MKVREPSSWQRGAAAHPFRASLQYGAIFSVFMVAGSLLNSAINDKPFALGARLFDLVSYFVIAVVFGGVLTTFFVRRNVRAYDARARADID